MENTASQRHQESLRNPPSHSQQDEEAAEGGSEQLPVFRKNSSHTNSSVMLVLIVKYQICLIFHLLKSHPFHPFHHSIHCQTALWQHSPGRHRTDSTPTTPTAPALPEPAGQSSAIWAGLHNQSQNSCYLEDLPQQGHEQSVRHPNACCSGNYDLWSGGEGLQRHRRIKNVVLSLPALGQNNSFLTAIYLATTMSFFLKGKNRYSPLRIKWSI